MPPPIALEVQKAVAIDAYRIPTVTAYNRLESTPRTTDFARSLRAEVRDPLWMLARQWQFGEFQAEDAASPVTAQMVGAHATMSHVGIGADQQFEYDERIPLEVQVEREALRGDLFLATQMARYFLRLMRDQGLVAAHLGRVRGKYPLGYTIDPNDTDALQLAAAVAGDLFDGFILHSDIVTVEGADTRFQKWMNAEGISAGDQAKFLTIAAQFTAWFARSYSQPGKDTSAWLPAQLEYQFEVQAPQDHKHLTADQYSQGHLDWYSFDFDGAVRQRDEPRPGESGTQENFVSFIPAPVGFKGMPNPRYWSLEEGQIDFGRIDTSTTGLLHLLFAEFGLVYGNDWFMLPYPLTINTLCEIGGMVVTDVFGQHTLIRPAGKGTESNWQRWTMFHHTDANTRGNTSQHYLTPAITGSLEGEPLERVNFLRDEMANLVWAVENTVPSQSGKGVNGNEIAAKERPPPTFVPVNDKVEIRYVAGTTVPDNWIPFIPVHLEGSDRDIRLQRARLPGAKGALGVIVTEKSAPYYVNEEEVPRAGVSVQRAFQRTRWLNGSTFLWIGRYKEAGKGEGWSNLKFDQIEDIPENLGAP